MTARTKYLGLAMAILVTVGLPLACASVGASDAPSGERDAADSPDGTNDGQGPEAAFDAGPCSSSKICRVPAPLEPADRLLSVSGSNATDVWAVGGGGRTLHYDGAVWEAANKVSAVDGSSSEFTLRNVWLGARDDVWISDGHRIRHTTGWKGPSATEWSFYPDRTIDCTPVAASGAGGVVWVAFGLATSRVCEWVMRFEGDLDGGGPQVLQYLDAERLQYPTAIATTRKDDVWINTSQPTWVGGNQNHIYRVFYVVMSGEPPAPEWKVEEYDTHTTRSAMNLWGNENVLWAVGESGMVRRLNPSTVTNKSFDVVENPFTETLYGVFGFGADDLWAVGENSAVIHWDGKSWTKLTTPFDHASQKPRLWSVWGSSPGDVWIVGDGAMLHYQENAP